MIFKNILIAVDGSKTSEKCIETACDLQKMNPDIALTFLCVYKHHSTLEASLSMADLPQSAKNNALKDYATEVVKSAKQKAIDLGAKKVKGFIKSGQPARTIVKFAKDKKMDLIVIGSRGHGDIEGFLLGSVSHKVTGLSHCPCLTIK